MVNWDPALRPKRSTAALPTFLHRSIVAKLSPVLCIAELLFVFTIFIIFSFDSVRQIKLAIRQFLGAGKCSLKAYRIVSYRIVAQFLCDI